MKNKRKIGGIMVLASFLIAGMISSCGGKTPDNPDPKPEPDPIQKPEKVDVTEISLELDKVNAKVGEILKPVVKIRPSNATNKEFALNSSDETIAKIEEGNIKCLSAGQVTITARSKDNPAKKSEVKLVVLGTDEEGRVENIFEAEEGNIIQAPNGAIKSEVTDDDRVSGTGVVGNLKKGDRIVWGVNSDETDDNALLKIRLMGPSGWLGMWDSIPYNFSDWYTIKVNGKVLNTENINVEGTYNKGGSADYYNVSDVELGKISLKKGLNRITFVCSNRFDQTTISDDKYNGTLSCWGNVDSISIKSSKNLTYVSDTKEAEGADPDVLFNTFKLEVEDPLTRVYESASNPKVDLKDSTSVEFKEKMNIMMDLRAEKTSKVKLALKVATPFVNKETAAKDVLAKDIFTINLDGKDISLNNATLKGNDKVNDKNNYSIVETGWFELKEGDNVLSVVANKDLSGYEFKGALDFVEVSTMSEGIKAFLNEEPTPSETFKFEAEAATTKLVNLDPVSEGTTAVEFKDAVKVQEDVYNNKRETSKIIFGIESSADTYATISMKVAAPYVNKTTKMEDINVGNLGDLWINGTLLSTPNTLKGNDEVGTKTNYTYFTVEEQFELKKGKNRIAWEPQNYTENTYEFLGALDFIEIEASSTLSAYEVNMWSDRNTYFDDANNEPINVTVDRVNETNPNACWVGLFKEDDSIEVNNPGSIYYYYPTNSAWNSDGQSYLGKPCNIAAQNPNKERPLISAATGGYYKIVYMEKDSRNGTNGYDIVDEIHISVWNDPVQYGGRKA